MSGMLREIYISQRYTKTWHKRLLLFSIMNTTAMMEVSKDLEANSFGICCHKLPWPTAIKTWSKLMRWENRQIVMQQELPPDWYSSSYRSVCRVLKLNFSLPKGANGRPWLRTFFASGKSGDDKADRYWR